MKKNILLIITVLIFLSFTGPDPQKLVILHPNGGEVFTHGSPAEIKWEYPAENGDNNQMVIVLYREGIKFKTLSSLAENTGIFIWSVSPDIPEGDKYRIRIRLSKDLSVNDFSDNDFSVKKRGDQ